MSNQGKYKVKNPYCSWSTLFGRDAIQGSGCKSCHIVVSRPGLCAQAVSEFQVAYVC